jgi:integrase
MKIKYDEDNGTYYFILSAGKDENGKRLQIKRRGFTTIKEAQQAMRKIIKDLEDQRHVKMTNATYNDFMKEWLQSKSLKLKEVTYNNYAYHISKHIAPDLGKHQMQKITVNMIEKFYIKLLNQKKLSPRTILDVHKIVKSSLDTAVKRRYIAYNHAADAEKPKVESKEMSTWPLDQVKTFMKTAHKDLYMVFALALSTGMRQSEILGLRWKDIDFENGKLSVVQTLSHNGKILSAETKTKASTRSIFLNEHIMNDLVQHKQIIEKEKENAESFYQDNNLVICTTIGTPLIPRNLLRSFYRLMKKAEVPKIRFHDLRHTVASLMLSKGINPKIVQEILGHADVRVTLDIYSHVLPSVHKDTAKEVEIYCLIRTKKLL